jgi:hypothetical protein
MILGAVAAGKIGKFAQLHTTRSKHHRGKAKAMAFKTEFEFTLPKGYVDDKGNLHRKGVMRLATAKDEIIPLQDFRVKNNRAYLVIILLSRVISALGDLKEGEVNPGIVEGLFSADLSYLQEFYRQINESGTANVGAKCPGCGQEFQVDIGTGATALGE